MSEPTSIGDAPTGTAIGTASATGTDTGADARYLAADGRPVAIGDKFHTPGKPEEKFVVDAIDSLFVYMKSDGWSSWPRVTKRWKFAKKGWVRCG